MVVRLLRGQNIAEGVREARDDADHALFPDRLEHVVLRGSDVASLLSLLVPLFRCSRSSLSSPLISQQGRMAVAPVIVPIFSGLGTSAAISEAWLQQSLSDSDSSPGSLLLHSCYHAFVRELSSLLPTDLRLLAISLDEFPTPASLLTHKRSADHIVLSHSFLFLSQALRWLSLIDSSKQDAFVQPLDATVGCLSFSLGVLMAPVIASSTTLLGYLSSAVEAYKVALWIGIRVHLHHHSNPSCVMPRDSSWSIACAGISPFAAQRLIADFRTAVSDAGPSPARPNSPSQNQEYPHIFLTATLSSSAVTISGPPHVLAAFTKSHPDAFSLLPAHIYGLYHVESVHKGTRDRVLCDIRRRGIQFPARDALKMPIISTFTGAPATADVPLVEEIVDMVLTQVADWDKVVSLTVERLKGLRRPVELLNVGPGNGLVNGLERQISATGLDVSLRDISTSEPTPPILEPIAIAGMAVNMPGAPNVDVLWELLRNGDSTLSQVRVGSQTVFMCPELDHSFLVDPGNAVRHDIHPRIPRSLLNCFSNRKLPFESRSIRQQVFQHLSSCGRNHGSSTTNPTARGI